MSNSDSTVTQLWNPVTRSDPEDRDDTFSETSVPTVSKTGTVHMVNLL
jgi:uncharacterized protein (UPF0261 family)